MATGQNRMVAIFTDSRGAPKGSTFFQKEINRLNTTELNINVYPFSGAKLEYVCMKASNYIAKNPGDIVYIMAGINDTTTPHQPLPWQHRKTYSFDWDSSDQFDSVMTKNFEDCIRHLYHLHNGQRIITCPVVGAQLNKICTNANDERQLIMDKGIWLLNQSIYHINRYNKTSTPWLTRTVHTSHKGSGKKVNYQDWLDDGLHPTEKLQTVWAELFIKHIKSIKLKIEKNGYTPV